MKDDDAGMAIEGFALQVYRSIMKSNIDRHHPFLSWADYRISGSESNFDVTKTNVLTTLAGLQDALHKDKNSNNVDVLNDLGDVEAELRNSKNTTDIGNAIRNARPLLDRAVERHNN